MKHRKIIKAMGACTAAIAVYPILNVQDFEGSQAADVQKPKFLDLYTGDGLDEICCCIAAAGMANIER